MSLQSDVCPVDVEIFHRIRENFNLFLTLEEHSIKVVFFFLL